MVRGKRQKKLAFIAILKQLILPVVNRNVFDKKY